MCRSLGWLRSAGLWLRDQPRLVWHFGHLAKYLKIRNKRVHLGDLARLAAEPPDMRRLAVALGYPRRGLAIRRHLAIGIGGCGDDHLVRAGHTDEPQPRPMLARTVG